MIWTIIVGVFAIIFYDSLVIEVVVYLIIGGLMLFDLMRKGVLSGPGRLGQIAGSQANRPAQVATTGQGQQTFACPSCGTQVTTMDAFCPSCGANLKGTAGVAPAVPTASPVAATSATKVCNSCGTVNPAGFAFCKRCGAKLA